MKPEKLAGRTFSLLLIFLTTLASAQSEKLAYQFFDAEGHQVSYQTVMDSLPAGDVIFFGELHNSAICHWLQLEMAIDLRMADTQRTLVLGAEMFERDDQLLLDEYLAGVIRERDFESSANLWNNYKTDYKPLVQLAVENNLTFVATNIPRRYAALVNRFGFEGLDSLSTDAKKLIAPLPIPYDPDLPGYKAMTREKAFKGKPSPLPWAMFFDRLNAISGTSGGITARWGQVGGYSPLIETYQKDKKTGENSLYQFHLQHKALYNQGFETSVVICRKSTINFLSMAG